MKRFLFGTVFVGAALLMTGCGDLAALHPWYTAEERVSDDGLAGRWEDRDDVLTLAAADDGYELTIQSKEDASKRDKYEVHLFESGGVRFADLIPVDGIGHMLVRVRVSEGRLRIAFFDSEWLRDRVPHEAAEVSAGRKQAVLTASTAELRRFIAKYGSKAKAYDEETMFKRVE